MDIGSAVGRAMGITEEQLMELPRFEESAAFTELEKLVLRLTVAMTKTPVDASDALFAELRSHFDEAQLVELCAAIAWENFRARFNRSLAVSPQGFSEGAFCVIPERSLPPSEGGA
jgi:alkylhydroperoxidase family enzyme